MIVPRNVLKFFSVRLGLLRMQSHLECGVYMFSLVAVMLFRPHQAYAQEISVLLGTDVPYQFYLGATLETQDLAFSLRSGVMGGPYSDLTLSILEMLGTDDVYLSVLESSYDVGLMNSVGIYYRMGAKRMWYVGPELRYDVLMASESSSELIETITNESISGGPPLGKKGQDITFGLSTLAAGFRCGRYFHLLADKRHRIIVELSIYKHYQIHTSITLNGEDADRMAENINTLLWEDVFRPYGYLGGVGIAYRYTH